MWLRRHEAVGTRKMGMKTMARAKVRKEGAWWLLLLREWSRRGSAMLSLGEGGSYLLSSTDEMKVRGAIGADMVK
jgi:hypothetical protein